RLWPVNSWSVKTISRLFAINERLVIYLRSEGQEIALVMVGATNVGKITATFDEEIITNQTHFSTMREKAYSKPIPVVKGQELGVFNMGSTVIVIYPPGRIDRLPVVGPHEVKMGQSLSNLPLRDL